jgi:hypothetical protein
MSFRNYCIAAIAATALYACQKQTQQAPAEETSNPDPRLPTENAIAANVTVTYTDESSFVSSLSSYGYKP